VKNLSPKQSELKKTASIDTLRRLDLKYAKMEKENSLHCATTGRAKNTVKRRMKRIRK